MKTLAPFIAVSLLAVAAQAADIYRWKDAAGSWHYSDQPVSGAEKVGTSRRVAASEDGGPPAGTAPPAAANASNSPNPGATSQTEQKVREDVAADRASKCKDAQTNYQQTITSRRLYRLGPKGEQVFLTDDEIDAARVSARSNMEYYCGK
ncbi:MAG: hypothetical protein RLZZ200_2933 [Pseudomonadota bacterium]|jgi:hypothetical protein